MRLPCITLAAMTVAIALMPSQATATNCQRLCSREYQQCLDDGFDPFSCQAYYENCLVLCAGAGSVASALKLPGQYGARDAKQSRLCRQADGYALSLSNAI